MRISTPGLQAASLATILNQQAAVAKSQEQVSSGLKFKTAGENPVGMAQVLSLQEAQSAHAQLSSNVSTLQQRLGSEDSALSSVSDTLSRVRELAVQANNATLSSANRESIATELDQLMAHLTDLANSSDGIGHYTFSGTADGGAPFSQGAASTIYAGTQDVRALAIGEGRNMAESDSGDAVFLRIRAGDGRVRVDAGSSNTGGLSLRGTTQASGATQAVTVTFSGGHYSVSDASNAVIQSGSYTAGQALTVPGAVLTLAGSPADGDTLNIKPAGNTSLFERVQNIITAVRAPTATAAERAANQTAFTNGLTELDAGIEHIANTRASVGARLSTLDEVSNRLGGIDEQLKTTLSQTRDLDYAEAASRLQLQTTALQAAQLAYTKVQGLSLFNYLH